MENVLKTYKLQVGRIILRGSTPAIMLVGLSGQCTNHCDKLRAILKFKLPKCKPQYGLESVEGNGKTRGKACCRIGRLLPTLHREKMKAECVKCCARSLKQAPLILDTCLEFY